MRDYPIFLFLFIIFLPYRYRLSMLRWPIIIVQSCSYISDKRGSVVASCRAWIKSRICFRGEGEFYGGSLGIYGRLYSSLLSSAPRSTAYNLRYRKIDVVDSPTIHAAFVTALVVASIVEIWKFYLPSRGICVHKRLSGKWHT